MSEFPVHPVPDAWRASAYINKETYEEMYQRSINDSDAFWAEQATQFLDWDKSWDQVCEYNMREAEAAWFSGGKLNVTVNA